MMETMLRSIATFDVRFIIRNLTMLEGGEHVLKYIPMTPLYPDRTVLQARTSLPLLRCRAAPCGTQPRQTGIAGSVTPGAAAVQHRPPSCRPHLPSS